MANNRIHISGEDLHEWVSSIGYLLPRTEKELARFEALFPAADLKVDASGIDPFAIINGTRQTREVSFSAITVDTQQQRELRMAARRQGEVPENIMNLIKKNQQSDDNVDRSENS